VKDLRCFRLLLGRCWDDPALPAMLDGLAKQTSRQRAPYFGLLLDLLWSDEPAAKALRARALACIVDGDGHLLVEAIVEGLGDEASRDAAMIALRAVASRQPARWVHALFHQDADVRARAVAEAAPPDALSFELFALADPAARDTILARKPKCGPEGIGAVLEFLSTKVIDAPLARDLLRDHAAVATWLAGSRRRAGPSLEAKQKWVVKPALFDLAVLEREIDDLDVILDLFWDDDKAGPLFAALAAVGELSERLVLSLIAVGLRKKTWPARPLELFFSIAPAMIGWTFVPEHVRRKAIDHALTMTLPLRRFAPALMQPLFFYAMCLHPDGGADLRTCAALMIVTNTGEAARQLAQWIGEPNLTDAIKRRPTDAAAYFRLLDKDDMFKKEVYFNVPGAAREEMLEAFVRDAPENALPFLAHVDAARLNGALADLVNRELDASRARRLAEIAVVRLDDVLLNGLLFRWRPRADMSEENATVQLGLALLFAAARGLEVERFVKAMTHSARTLPVILGVIEESPSFPYGKEIALAHALRENADPFARRWAEARVRPPEPPVPIAAPPTDDALARAIVTCKRADLARLVEPFAKGGRAGLAGALARRTDNPSLDVKVTIALLGSRDPLDALDVQLARYGGDGEELLRQLETELASRHGYVDAKLSLLGHATLWRWERHGKAFLDLALETWKTMPAVVLGLTTLKWPLARRIGLQALADAIAVMGARDKERAAQLIDAELTNALVVALASDVAPWAADALLSTWRFAKELLVPVEGRVRSIIVDLDQPTRDKLAGWIDAIGLPSRAPALPKPSEPDEVTLARVRASTDPSELGRFCGDARVAIVQEATLRLLELGEIGRAELARILETADDDAQVGPIAESLALWDDGPALERARAASRDPSKAAHVRFEIAISMLERNERAFDRVIVEAMNVHRDRAWFRPEHWTKLTTRLGFDATALAIATVTSSQPHVYLPAAQHLVNHGEGDAALVALRAFLEEGTLRMGSLRRLVAEHLHSRGDFTGFPIVVEQELEASKGESRLLVGVDPKLVRAVTLAFLAAGNAIAKEASLLHHLAPTGVDFMAKDEAYETILLHCASDPIRQRAALAIRSGLRRLHKLMRVAETFAWGARMGQELLGRLYRVQMTGGQSLGHTFMQERKIWVTPLPILRGDRHGREIVEALILHEYGHHLYHRGKDGMAVWDQAQKEGIHGLLN
jgi:hypothetical protein